MSYAVASLLLALVVVVIVFWRSEVRRLRSELVMYHEIVEGLLNGERVHAPTARSLTAGSAAQSARSFTAGQWVDEVGE